MCSVRWDYKVLKDDVNRKKFEEDFGISWGTTQRNMDNLPDGDEGT